MFKNKVFSPYYNMVLHVLTSHHLEHFQGKQNEVSYSKLHVFTNNCIGGHELIQVNKRSFWTYSVTPGPRVWLIPTV